MSSRYSNWCLWIPLFLLGTMLVVFSVFAFYNYPNWDEYLYINRFREQGFWQVLRWSQEEFTGRYMMTFMMSVVAYLGEEHPLIIVQWTPFLGIGSFLISTYWLLKMILKDALPRQFFIYVYCMLCLYLLTKFSAKESFYWTSAVFVYGFGTAGVVLSFRHALEARISSAKDLLLSVGVSFFLAFFSVGLFEVLAPLIAGGMCLLIWSRARGLRLSRCAWPPLAGLSGALIGFWINASAPGWDHRTTDLNHFDGLPSFLGEHYVDLLKILLHPVFILFLFVCAIIALKYASRLIFLYRIKSSHVLAIHLLFFGWDLCVALLLSYTEGYYPDRMKNVVLPFFVSLAVFDAFYASKFISSRKLTSPRPNLVVSACIILSSFTILLSGNVPIALLDLGKIAAYRSVQEENYRILNQNRGNTDLDVQLLPFKEKPPRTLYTFNFNHKDPSHYFNRSLARYFGIRSVSIEQNDSPPPQQP